MWCEKCQGAFWTGKPVSLKRMRKGLCARENTGLNCRTFSIWHGMIWISILLSWPNCIPTRRWICTQVSPALQRSITWRETWWICIRHFRSSMTSFPKHGLCQVKWQTCEITWRTTKTTPSTIKLLTSSSQTPFVRVKVSSWHGRLRLLSTYSKKKKNEPIRSVKKMKSTSRRVLEATLFSNTLIGRTLLRVWSMIYGFTFSCTESHHWEFTCTRMHLLAFALSSIEDQISGIWTTFLFTWQIMP